MEERETHKSILKFLEEEGVCKDGEESSSSSEELDDEEENEEEYGSPGLADEKTLPPPRISQEEEAAVAALIAPEGDIHAFLASVTQKATRNMHNDILASPSMRFNSGSRVERFLP